VKAGDYAVFTVRRGCGECACCLMNRADMCQTGKYRERGIRGLDGYQTEYAVDQEQYVVRVPAELEPVGVLMEPLSVVEKAIDEALRVQTVRCPDAATTPDWFHGRRCLVAGLGRWACWPPWSCACGAARFTVWMWSMRTPPARNGWTVSAGAI
jgi:glucose 1-dehydrogenase